MCTEFREYHLLPDLGIPQTGSGIRPLFRFFSDP